MSRAERLRLTPRATGLVLLALLTGCGGGGGGGGDGAGASAAPGQDFLGDTPPRQDAGVIAAPAPALPHNNAAFNACPSGGSAPADAGQPGIVSGRITFDRVPFGALGSGLDFSAIAAQPARGVVVELVQPGASTTCQGTVLDTAVTNGDGWYSLDAGNPSTTVCVRARAQLYRAGSPAWNIAVADNTDGNSLYVMADSRIASASAEPVRDLHAASGWDGAAYGGPRVAAPFAILDTACSAMNAMLSANAAARFGTLSLLWSVNNTETSGALDQGQIGSAFYDPDTRAIYLRGDAAVNTDEFDQMVIAHEFGHFLTHTFSRSDSIGGEHDLTENLDPRLAFDEGWATAFAALALGTPDYRDSLVSGDPLVREYAFDLRDSASYYARGWYAEASVQRLLYNEGVASGLNALLATFRSDAYRGSPALASIFSFASRFKQDHPARAGALTAAMVAENIDGNDAFAGGESHAPNPARDLPWYTPISVGVPVQVCSHGDYGVVNKLSNRRYLRLDVGSSGRYRIVAQPAPGNSGAVAGLELLRGSVYLEPGSTGIYLDFRTGSSASPTVATTATLDAGATYLLGVFHLGNQLVGAGAPAPGYQCLTVSVNPAP